MSDLDLDDLRNELADFAQPEKKVQRSAKEERVIAGFEEIQRFVDQNGRAPLHGEDRDIFERLYAVRLDRLRAARTWLAPNDKESQAEFERLWSEMLDGAPETGATLVHAFADAWVIEGQGSAGVEIAAQLGRPPSRLVACCGGGGLSAGLALACLDSAIHVVEPQGWDMVGRALEAGEVVRVSFGPQTSEGDVDRFLVVWTAMAHRARS